MRNEPIRILISHLKRMGSRANGPAVFFIWLFAGNVREAVVFQLRENIFRQDRKTEQAKKQKPVQDKNRNISASPILRKEVRSGLLSSDLYRGNDGIKDKYG